MSLFEGKFAPAHFARVDRARASSLGCGGTWRGGGQRQSNTPRTFYMHCPGCVLFETVSWAMTGVERRCVPIRIVAPPLLIRPMSSSSVGCRRAGVGLAAGHEWALGIYVVAAPCVDTSPDDLHCPGRPSRPCGGGVGGVKIGHAARHCESLAAKAQVLGRGPGGRAA